MAVHYVYKPNQLHAIHLQAGQCREDLTVKTAAFVYDAGGTLVNYQCGHRL